MPEVLGGPPSPRTPLAWDGTRYRAVRGHTDGTVQVRGEDQLHSFGGVLSRTNTGVISGADGFLASNVVPAGQIWHVTLISARDRTTATTSHQYVITHDAASLLFHDHIAARVADGWSSYRCNLWLDPGDTIDIYFIGGLVGDQCTVQPFGEIMTLEV